MGNGPGPMGHGPWAIGPWARANGDFVVQTPLWGRGRSSEKQRFCSMNLFDSVIAGFACAIENQTCQCNSNPLPRPLAEKQLKSVWVILVVGGKTSQEFCYVEDARTWKPHQISASRFPVCQRIGKEAMILTTDYCMWEELFVLIWRPARGFIKAEVQTF